MPFITFYFEDQFAGAGALVNSQPTQTLNAAITAGWQVVTGYQLTRDGTGWVKVDGAVNDNYGQGILRLGTDNTDWGVSGSPPTSLYGPISASFTVRTPPTLTGFGQNLIGIKVHVNGVLMTAAINHQYDEWWLRITGAADRLITSLITPDTVYSVEANFVSGDSSVTVTELGITEHSSTAFTSSVGLSSVYVCVTERGALGPITILPLPEDTTVRAIGTAPALLGEPRLLLQHDFTGQIGDSTSVYGVDLITPGGAVRVPISSWQATLRTGSSSYVQCVIPACTAWVDSLNAATEFVVSRRVLLPGGVALEAEMARAPAEQVQFDRGPQRHTCTLSGYGGGFAANPAPDALFDRTLTGLRSVSSSDSGRRVRCAVDWLLRPGQRAFVDGAPLLVGYINYYAPSGFDSYMDVGEQQ